MAATITSVVPGRVRTGDTLELHGTGFNVVLAQNVVTIDGQAATVTAATAIKVDVTVPAAVTPGPPHVKVILTNVGDGTVTTWWAWIKPTVLALSTAILPFKEPFLAELDLGPLSTTEDPRLALSKSFERWAAGIELLDRDLVTVKGAMATAGAAGAGLIQAAAGALNDYLSTFAAGAKFQTRQVWTLHWGRLLLAANGAPTLMEAGATDAVSTVTATEEVAPKAGTLLMWSVFGSNGSFANRVNTIELLKNGVVVDTRDLTVDPGIGIGSNSLVTFYVSVPVAQGDRIEVRLTKNGTTAAAGLRAMAQVV